MNKTTSAGMSPTMKEYYDKKLLERMLPRLCFVKHGQKKPLPKGNGKTIEFRKFNSLALATTPLTEGEPPAGKDLSMTKITATVSQYGDYVSVSDVLDQTAYDPVIAETVEILGEQAGETLDVITQNILLDTTSEYNVGGGLDVDAITATNILTSEDLLKIRTIFKRNNVKPFEGKYYLMFCSPEQLADIMRDSLWLEVSKYSASKKIFDGEIGEMRGFRFIDTSLVEPIANTGGIDVFSGLALGQHAYGIVDPDGGKAGSAKPKTIMKIADDNDDDRSDPLNQFSTIGWKAMFTAVILYELALIRVNSAATEIA